MASTTFVISPYLQSAQTSDYLEENRFIEAIELAKAISLKVIYSEKISLRKFTPASFMGKGKIEEIGEIVEEKEPDVIIMNCALTPVQQRNLEKAWKAKVIDRTGLILEIFGERAQTKEGQLQVELAALEYQRSRLVRSWTHLERQRGGAGFMGGPGETQIEIDRRLIGERITSIKNDLDKIRKNRDLQKSARDKIPYPAIAIVGYTNAGKSTLFNKLTKSKILAKDMLFATLDTTMRGLKLPSGIKAILSDTVGFIVDLPTNLVAAFRATLEQLNYADIILHVQDISSPDHEEQRKSVEDILKSFDISPDAEHVIHIYNKIDLLADADKEEYLRFIKPNEVYCSAVSGEGLEEILTRIDDRLKKDFENVAIQVDAANGKIISWLHKNSDILKTQSKKEKMLFTLSIHPRELGKLKRAFESDEYKIAFV